MHSGSLSKVDSGIFNSCCEAMRQNTENMVGIAGFEGFYMFDPVCGAVFSVKKGRYLVTQKLRGRYCSVELWKGNKRSRYYFHATKVKKSKYPENPEKCSVVLLIILLCQKI